MALWQSGARTAKEWPPMRVATAIDAFDDTAALPAAANGDAVPSSERRMVQRLFVYWDRLRRGRAIPSMSDIRPEQLPADWSSCFIINVGQWPDGSGAISHLGSDLLADADLGPESEDSTSIPQDTLFGRAVTDLPDVLATGIPFLGEGSFRHARGGIMAYRSILLPFGASPDRVEDILGAIVGRHGK